MWLLFVVLITGGQALRGGVDARFLSPETEVIANFKVPQLLSSAAGPDVRQWVVDSLYGCPMADSVVSTMRRVQFSARHAGEGPERRAEWLIVLDGMWDWPAAQECVRQAGHQEARHRGVPMMIPARRQSGAASIAHYEGDFLLVGEEEVVRGAIDRAMDETVEETELVRRAKQLDAEWDHWVTGQGSPLDFNGKTRKEALEEIPKPKLYWLAISGSDLFSVELRLEMMTPEEAALVLRLLEFLPQIARLRAAEDKMRPDLLSLIKVEANGRSVTVSARVPGPVLWVNFRQLTAGTVKRSRFGRERLN